MMPFSPNENTGHIINYYIWFHKQVSTYIHSAQCFSSWFSGKDWEKLLNVNYLITIPNICLCQVSMIWLYKSPILYFCMLHHINEKKKKKNQTLPMNGITQKLRKAQLDSLQAIHLAVRKSDYNWSFKRPVNKFRYTTDLSRVSFLLNEAM